MKWFFFFKDGVPQMVRFALTRGYAIEQVEQCYHKRWAEFEAAGFTCVAEKDVLPDVWEKFCGKKEQCPIEVAHSKRVMEYREGVQTALIREVNLVNTWRVKNE